MRSPGADSISAFPGASSERMQNAGDVGMPGPVLTEQAIDDVEQAHKRARVPFDFIRREEKRDDGVAESLKMEALRIKS